MPKLRRFQSSEIFTFLELLEKYPIIWNFNMKEHHNPSLRDSQIKLMLSKLAKKNITLSVPEFKVRLKNIKDTYRVTLKQFKKRMENGKDADSRYEPSLVWYDKADSFLRNVINVSRPSLKHLNGHSTKNLDSEQIESTESNETLIQSKVGLDELSQEVNDFEDLLDYSVEEVTSGKQKSSTSRMFMDNNRNERNTNRKGREQVLNQAVKDAVLYLNGVDNRQTQDVNDEFGRYVASQLKTLSPITATRIRTKIQLALNEAVLESLS